MRQENVESKEQKLIRDGAGFDILDSAKETGKKSKQKQRKSIKRILNFNLKNIHSLYKKIDTRYKVAFYSSLAIGLLIHIYKFVNTLRLSDSLFSFYSDQNIISQGRWFLSIACGFSSYFDLPWVIGILSLIFVAVATCIIVNIFDIENNTLIVLVSGLIVAFPSLTEIFQFEFTADGYMIAMFLATLAVYLSKIGDNKIWHIAVATICICLSCGIYQAFASFGLVLATCYFILCLLDNKYKIKDYLRFIRNQAIIYIVGVGLYYVIWKLLLKFVYTDLQLPNYMGVSKVGTVNILGSAYKVLKAFFTFFVYDLYKYHTITFFVALNIIFAVFALAMLVFAFIKAGLYKKPFNAIFFILSLAAVPFFVFALYFSSPGLTYATRMEYSICILYIFIAVLIFKYAKVYSVNLGVLLFACIIFNNGINANITYYQMNLRNEETYALATELASRIHQLDDGNIKYIAFISKYDLYSISPNDSDFINPDSNKVSYSAIHTPDYIIRSVDHTCQYLKNVLNFQLEYYKNHPEVSVPVRERDKNADKSASPSWKLVFPLASEEKTNELKETSEVKEMSIFPYANSIKVMGDTVVVKLSNVK